MLNDDSKSDGIENGFRGIQKIGDEIRDEILEHMKVFYLDF